MPKLPALRQIVLIVPDLGEAVARAREIFGFTSCTRDVEAMEELGFIHEIFSFADTFIEIVAPIDADSPHGQMVARQGAGGYMVDVQVANLDELVDRAGRLDIAPLFVQGFEGHRISQWHPKTLGTLAEFDQVEPHDTWHFAPGIFEASCTDVARDIIGAEISTDDPKVMAQKWSQVVGAPVLGNATVELAKGSITFVPADGRKGLTAVDVIATDPARIGESVILGGVEFRFVAEGENV
ncbi:MULTISPECIES: VOC family protein [Rhodococcus]|uniref:VOC family protein n=1 Tax=Rhodococcus globerulus TaxID=33008 RepID=A0ABU4BXK1_RHOGO|nr:MULTISPECIES: VOC family protein [Rhodococcus]MDV6268970.1 VOC family protein [Rhodococcus globerulus]MDV8067454.1 VOC family protein [Rhodococcus sp. IEGM 1366]